MIASARVLSRRLGLLTAIAFAFVPAKAQHREGWVERMKVSGKSLEGNLAGDPATRDVTVYLPPSYKTVQKRRYPVVYMLHGFTDDDARWFGVRPHWMNLASVLNESLGRDDTREMIVVMPNAYTRYLGSMYSNSVTTGDWETYVARELVAYIDAHYRTIANANSRGLAGHSMGGYGALRIGMKYPDVFSSVYALSPCCLMPNTDPQRVPETAARAEAITSPADLERADFGTKAMIASAAAWSPNPKKPPLFLDLPWKNGEFQPMVAAKWAANSPIARLDQHVANVRQLRALAFDAGDRDMGIAASIKVLHDALTAYEIPHSFEVYEGTHTDRIAERIRTKLMPFFSQNLAFR